MISKFLKENIAKSLLENYLVIEVLSEIFKIDEDKVLELLTAYINNKQ